MVPLPHARTWVGFSVTCCEHIVGPLTFSCTVWPPLAGCPGVSVSQSHPHRDHKSVSSRVGVPIATAGSCRDFCSGVLWFSVSASLFNFGGQCFALWPHFSDGSEWSCWFPVCSTFYLLGWSENFFADSVPSWKPEVSILSGLCNLHSSVVP